MPETFPRLIVVVDDERTFESNSRVIYLRDSTHALAYLARKLMHQQTEYGEAISELWLDHDLGYPKDYPPGQPDTIGPVINFLDMMAQTQFKIQIDKIFVHSQNSSGSERMMLTLSKHYSVMRVPLPELVKT